MANTANAFDGPPVTSTSPADRQTRMVRKMSVAEFDGSFAPLFRPSSPRILPWYRDREYFLGSWFSPPILRSAVSVVFIGTRLSAQFRLTSYFTRSLRAWLLRASATYLDK